MITGLPAYQAPVVESVFCHCRAFYRVYMGVEGLQAVFAEKEALRMGAIFIDARATPFYQCECGEVLDFTPECVLTIQ
jgi:hypothetical protein